jgi:ABC-type branched-subunit amino acid transport system ATPase component
MSMLALETKSLCKTFGALAVASDIHFKLERGARHALIGPNGAGKTSFVNLVTGVLAPTSGQILLGGEDITALTRAQRVKRGLAEVAEDAQDAIEALGRSPSGVTLTNGDPVVRGRGK